LQDQLDQLEKAHSKACCRSNGLLPHGVIGDQVFSAHWGELEALTGEIHHQGVNSRNFEIELDGWRIYWRLPVGKNNGIVTYYHDEPKAGNKLTLWLQHLALCASDHSAKEGVLLYPAKTKVSMIKLARQDAPKAQALLSQLLWEYQKGLRDPLYFFPKSALAYYEKIQAGGDAKDAAKKAWYGNDYERGETTDLWHHYLYRSPDPFANEGFMSLAQKIFQPYHDALVKESKSQGKKKPGKKPPDAR
jgi:exodeoxyribonuclease V gamma subunit